MGYLSITAIYIFYSADLLQVKFVKIPGGHHSLMYRASEISETVDHFLRTQTLLSGCEEMLDF